MQKNIIKNQLWSNQRIKEHRYAKFCEWGRNIYSYISVAHK